MEFPVDILANVDPGSLEQSAKSYMSKLLFKNLEIHEYLNIPGSKKVRAACCFLNVFNVVILTLSSR